MEQEKKDAERGDQVSQYLLLSTVCWILLSDSVRSSLSTSTPSCCSCLRVALTTGSPALCCFLLDDDEDWEDREDWEDWERSTATDRLLLLGSSSSTSCLLSDS